MDDWENIYKISSHPQENYIRKQLFLNWTLFPSLIVWRIGVSELPIQYFRLSTLTVEICLIMTCSNMSKCLFPSVCPYMNNCRIIPYIVKNVINYVIKKKP